MNRLMYFTCLLIMACQSKQEHVLHQKVNTPLILDDGNKIVFQDSLSIDFFSTAEVSRNILKIELTAPSNITALVLNKEANNSNNIILFDNPDLASNYTAILQHNATIKLLQDVNIKNKQLEVDRVKDLEQHGAESGRDLLIAETGLSLEKTNLSIEKAATIEHITKLEANGFDPQELQNADPGTAFIICEVPENQIYYLKTQNSCRIEFTAYPNKYFYGKINAITDLLDETTRKVKLRITIPNAQHLLKAGMFGLVHFGVSQGEQLNIPKNALVTIQGNNYVFVKTASNEFERRAVQIGDEVNDNIIIFSGLIIGEKVAVNGVMQLKGLSFGY
ncbi:MAG: efflux RND transporter periplasmic adaptor subunit [Alphaproteobacteria bacterium]|nr:efflux RND transporter periplasmic adaptor subunit [Alphaproteobacteria bacterium]